MRARSAGFTLIEVTIATAMFGALMAAFVMIGSMTLGAYAEESSRASLFTSGTRALARIQGDLRETGRRTVGAGGQQRSYPYLFTDGGASGYFAPYAHTPIAPNVEPGSPANGPSREIVFLQTKDLDGDGYPTDHATGQTEWGPDDFLYVLRKGASNVNELVRETNGNFAEILARHVERMVFDDQTTDATLGPNVVRVRLFLVSKDVHGQPVSVTLESLINMRNMSQQ